MLRYSLSFGFTFLACLVLGFGKSSLAADRIGLDTASVEQLASLNGVDEGLAKAIVELRSKRGGHLTSVDALRVLPSMTPSALAELRRSTSLSITLTMDVGNGFKNVEDVLGQFAHEPAIQKVQIWTNQYAKTSPEMVQSWLRASRGFAALPKLRLEYRLTDGWDQDFVYELADGTEAVPVKDDAGNDRENRVLVQVNWDLSELVMSSDRIRIINEAQDVVKLRDKLLSQVTRLYFDRRRHQVEMLLNPRTDLDGQVEDQLRLMELTAGIDALTGGQFSNALGKSSL